MEEQLNRQLKIIADEQKRMQTSEEWALVWNSFIDILEHLSTLYRTLEMEFSEFSTVFAALTGNIQRATPPRTLDAVLISQGSTARLNAPKIVFLLGVCEGTFPAFPGGSMVFSERDCEFLPEDVRLSVAKPAESQMADARLAAYKLLSSASHALYLTYPVVDVTHQKCYPSAVIAQIQRTFPEAETLHQNCASLEPSYYSVTMHAAYYQYVQNYAAHNTDTASIEQLLLDDASFAEKLKRLGKLAEQRSEDAPLFSISSPELMQEFIEKDDLVILGNRVESQMCALDIDVSCMVVCQNAEVSKEVIKRADEQSTVIISTPHDTFTAARLINQSIPVRYIMKTDNLVTFNTEDFTDDIQNEMIKHRHRAFPVINKKGKCIGTISRRNFLDMHRKKVALVDHNEKDQAVDNIDKAEIVEIIDHHKLGSLETMVPISFRNQPVGCTATILYEMYGEQKLEISPSIAGLLCAAIISDTLMFRSPTCTLSDKMAAGALALIAGINIEQFAKEMFKAGSNLKDKSPEEIFYQDYKKFIAEDEINFGVGQISSMDSDELAEIKERLVPFMVSECGRHGVTRVFFMLTNIIEESTELLYYGEGSEEMARIAFHMEPKDGVFDLKGVVSRKKQLIPPLMEAAQMIGSDYV